MVKLVYTLASGASWRKPVQVQVLFRAQKVEHRSVYLRAGSSEGIPSGKSCSGHFSFRKLFWLIKLPEFQKLFTASSIDLYVSNT